MGEWEKREAERDLQWMEDIDEGITPIALLPAKAEKVRIHRETEMEREGRAVK